MKRRATIVGIFNDHIATIDAINDLRQLGFSDDQLGFVVRLDINRDSSTDKHDANAIAYGLVSGLLGAAAVPLLPTKKLDNVSIAQKAISSTTEEAIDRLPHLGIITSGVIGGTLGAVASLQLPAIGPVVAGGVLAAILGSADPGGIVGGFLSMGIPEQKAHYYEQQFQAGNIIFTIRANGEQQEACAILHHHGALSTEAH